MKKRGVPAPQQKILLLVGATTTVNPEPPPKYKYQTQSGKPNECIARVFLFILEYCQKSSLLHISIDMQNLKGLGQVGTDNSTRHYLANIIQLNHIELNRTSPMSTKFSLK